MNCNIRKITAFIVCVVLIAILIPLSVFAQEKDKPFTVGELGGYLAGNARTVKNLYLERRFTEPAGHAFAAERANNLADVLKGKKASVVGDNNAKNGPDRKIVNRDGSVTWIQDKYYKTARASFNAAFDATTGEYRYYDADGTPMQLEVPKDQYKAVVEQMREKISAGKVKGVTDPNEAENYVRKGKYTYKQAVNLTKAGTIDSLKYDAKNGTVSATIAFGITFVLDYATCRIHGEDNIKAIKNACFNGLKNGSLVCGSYIIASQLAKTNLPKALAPTSEAVAKALGPGVQKALVQTAGVNAAEKTGSHLVKATSKILQDNMITTGVILVALSTPEVINLFNGRISKKQFVKDMAILIASTAGATAGSFAGGAAGTAVAPGAGTTVGAIVGGTALGTAAGYFGDKVLSLWYKGDASQMYDIITTEFQSLAEEYLISEEEGAELVDTLKDKLEGKTLKDMYASKNRKKFARKLLTPLFVEEADKRDKVTMPTAEEIRADYKKSLQGIVFVH